MKKLLWKIMVWRHWVWLTFRAAHQNHQQELNSSYYCVSTGACWEQDGQSVAEGAQTAHYASADGLPTTLNVHGGRQMLEGLIHKTLCVFNQKSLQVCKRLMSAE